MVTGTHPEDIVLFDYVEGDLPDAGRSELEVHLASCAHCAERVARLQAGRDELRRAQFLQLPPHRRDAILRHLPERPRAARSFPFSPKRALAVLTPIAVVAAAVVAIVSTGGIGNGGEEGAAGGDTNDAAQTFAPEAAGGAAGTSPDPRGKQPLSVAGSAEAVAARLRQRGFDAVALGDRVQVRDATRAEVLRALAGRRDGSVRIVIVP